MKKIIIAAWVLSVLVSCKKVEICSDLTGSYTLTEAYFITESGAISKPDIFSGKRFILYNCEDSKDRSNPEVYFPHDYYGTYQYQLSDGNDRKITFPTITSKDSAFSSLFSKLTFRIEQLTENSMKLETVDTVIKNSNGLKYKTSRYTFVRRDI